ncbi:hypothetical protein, partial [Streptomyces sp. NPDC127574]
MRQQGVHPEDAEGTSDVSSRPDTGGDGGTDEKGTSSSSEKSATGAAEPSDSSAEETSSEADETAPGPLGPDKRQARQDCEDIDEAHADE